MLALFLIFAAAATQPTAQQQPVSVQVNQRPALCGHVHFTPGFPEVGVDAGRDFAADQASLRLTVAGTEALAQSMGVPFGIVLMSKDATSAMAAGKSVVYTYTTHQGKDTVVVTFPAAASLGCK